MIKIIVFILTGLLTTTTEAKAFPYPEYSTSKDGLFETFAYSEQIHLMDVDAVPEKIAKKEYVSLLPVKPVSDSIYDVQTRRTVKYDSIFNVSCKNQERLIVYIHGAGRTRLDGMNDWTFGGNFNRLKNLAYKNCWTYISPDFTDFTENGARQVARIVEKAGFDGKSVILACGSSGGELCKNLVSYAKVKVSGLIFMGAAPSGMTDAIGNRRIPVIYAHGTKDKSVPVSLAINSVKTLKNAGIRVKATLFTGGSHGTPIRMTNWDRELSWLISGK